MFVGPFRASPSMIVDLRSAMSEVPIQLPEATWPGQPRGGRRRFGTGGARGTSSATPPKPFRGYTPNKVFTILVTVWTYNYPDRVYCIDAHKRWPERYHPQFGALETLRGPDELQNPHQWQ